MVYVHALVLFTLAAAATVYGQSCENPDAEVLILGAGIAGISAAKTLHENGKTDFLILEQDNRMGGRMKEAPFAGATVEFGWQWIWSKIEVDPSDLSDPINAAYALAIHCGLQFNRGLAINPFGPQVAYDRNGVNITDKVNSAVRKYFRASVGARQFAAQLAEEDPDGIRDLPAVVGLRVNGWNPRTPEEQLADYLWFSFPSCLASDATSLRKFFLNSAVVVPHLVTDERGFSHIVRCLANDFLGPKDSRLHFNTAVTAIKYSSTCVCASVTENGESRQYCAPHAILTFSVGSLKAGTVKFDPELPASKILALNHIGMCNLLKIYIAFNQTFWDVNADVILVADDIRGREYYPFFIPYGSLLPTKRPILQALLIGEAALRVGQKDTDTIKQEIVEVLKRIYGDRVTEPVDLVRGDFVDSPYFYGDYTSYAVGVRDQTYEDLAATVGQLYFSGEGTFAPFPRNVQSGYHAGINTANLLLQDIKDGQPLGAQFINNTPRIVGNSVEAEFITTGPVTSVICSLGSGVRQDCSSGTVRFTDLTSGVYTLKVILRSGSGEREVLKSKVVIPVKDEL